MLVYGKYVRSLVARRARTALWRDYRVVGRRFGLRERDMPRDIDAFEAYMADMYASGELFVTPAARELAIDIVLHPPVPLAARPLVELVNQITVGLVAGRPPPPVRLPLGPAARRRAARRRGVRQARRPDSRVEPGLNCVCQGVRERRSRITPSMTSASKHRRRPRRADGGVDQPEQAGEVEAVLDDRDVDQQRRDVDAGHRGDRGRGDRQRVAVDHAPLGQALGAAVRMKSSCRVLAQVRLGDPQHERGERERRQQPRHPHRLAGTAAGPR